MRFEQSGKKILSSTQLSRAREKLHRFVPDLSFRATLMQASALLTNIRLAWKGLRGTNTLAYFAATSVTKKKSLINIETCF